MRWIVSIFVFFGVVFVVNMFVVYFAISSNSELVEDAPYQRGLHYQEVIDAKQRARNSGLEASIRVLPNDAQSDTIEVRLAQSAPTALSELPLKAWYSADSKGDARLRLKRVNETRFAGSFPKFRPGIWFFTLEIPAEDGAVMRWEEKLVIR